MIARFTNVCIVQAVRQRDITHEGYPNSGETVASSHRGPKIKEKTHSSDEELYRRGSETPAKATLAKGTHARASSRLERRIGSDQQEIKIRQKTHSSEDELNSQIKTTPAERIHVLLFEKEVG